MTIWVVLGSFLAGLGVVLGAFGSHGLEGVLSADQLDTYEVAVRYQMLHALVLVVVGLFAEQHSIPLWIPLSFLVGILLFSGSIYALVLGPGWKFLGPVTPLGGLCLIVGWFALFGWSLWKYLAS